MNTIVIIIIAIALVYFINLIKGEEYFQVAIEPDNYEWPKSPKEYCGKKCDKYYQTDDRNFLIVNPWMLPHSAKSCPEDYQLKSPCVPDHEVKVV